MNEIHSIPPIYPVNMPNRFIRERKKQSKQNQLKQEKNNDVEDEESNEATIKHIDEIV